MGIFTSLFVFLSIVASGVHLLQAKSDSPVLSYWETKLPNTPIPTTLRELIIPEDVEEELAAVSVGVGKGGVHVGVQGKPPRKAGTPATKPQPKPQPKPGARKGVGVSVKPPVKGKGGVGVSVGTPGKGVGVHVGTKSPYDYNYAADAKMLADPSYSMFFLEKDLHPGTKVSLYLVKRSTGGQAYFIPRYISDKIPFSSDKLSVALEYLNVSEGSEAAVTMKDTVEECESPAINGESKYCATSLESMIDYSTSKLGTNNINVLVTNVPKDSKKQKYTITAVPFRSTFRTRLVVCHSQAYAYAVYYCHETENTETVKVSLKGEDGTSVEGVAVCHADTSAWNPNHVAFKLLNVKPGGAAICHFIPEDHVVWLPAN